MTSQVLSSIIGAIATTILAVIGKSILGMKKDFHRFMTEHMWLLATALWNRNMIQQIMQLLEIEPENPPPGDLPLAGDHK